VAPLDICAASAGLKRSTRSSISVAAFLDERTIALDGFVVAGPRSLAASLLPSGLGPHRGRVRGLFEANSGTRMIRARMRACAPLPRQLLAQRTERARHPGQPQIIEDNRPLARKKAGDGYKSERRSAFSRQTPRDIQRRQGGE